MKQFKFEIVDEFNFLDFITTNNNDENPEVAIRIAKGSKSVESFHVMC